MPEIQETATVPQEATETPPRLLPPAHQDARDFEVLLANLSRGQLAQLKRNVGQPLPGRGVAWFYGLLYQGNVEQRRYNAEIYFLVATLYDLNRLTTPRGDRAWGNLGSSMRRAAGDESNASVKRRFQILLDADFDDPENLASSELAFRLRQTVQWLKGQNVGFDPAQLIYDLYRWRFLERKAQKEWARAFFAAPSEAR